MQANMRRIVSILLAVMFCVACFTGCGSSKDNGGTASVDVRNAKSIADLAGAKIAAQTGTFHADALEQIPNVQASTYPEFSDLLTALKSGAIDGYVAEEPTAFSVCASNDDLTYLPFKNNDTGFTATAADVGIAIGLKKGNALRDQIKKTQDELNNLKYQDDTVYADDIAHLKQLAEWMYERVDVICQSWDISLAIPDGESMSSHQSEILAPIAQGGNSALNQYDANVGSWKPQQRSQN